MAESIELSGRIPVLLSVGSVAAILDLSLAATKRIPPAELPYTRVGARGDRRYQQADVERYIAKRRVAS